MEKTQLSPKSTNLRSEAGRFGAPVCLRVFSSPIQKARAEWRAPSVCLRIVKEGESTMGVEKKASSPSVDPFQPDQEKRVAALLRSATTKLSRGYREAIARQKLRDKHLNDLLDDDC